MDLGKGKRLPKLLVANFSALIVIFVLFLSFFFVPAAEDILRPYFLVMIFAFLILGVSLTIISYKANTQEKLRKFLLITGVSATGFPLFAVLHNLFYALGILAQKVIVLYYLFEILHVISFLFSSIVFPIGLVVGIFSTIYFYFTESSL